MFLNFQVTVLIFIKKWMDGWWYVLYTYYCSVSSLLGLLQITFTENNGMLINISIIMIYQEMKIFYLDIFAFLWLYEFSHISQKFIRIIDWVSDGFFQFFLKILFVTFLFTFPFLSVVANILGNWFSSKIYWSENTFLNIFLFTILYLHPGTDHVFIFVWDNYSVI